MDYHQITIRQWINDLRSGKFLQGTGVLKRVLTERVEYCCLGVACETAECPTETGRNVSFILLNKDNTNLHCDLAWPGNGPAQSDLSNAVWQHRGTVKFGENVYLTQIVGDDFSGLAGESTLEGTLYNVLMGLNDRGQSFNVIADVLEFYTNPSAVIRLAKKD